MNTSRMPRLLLLCLQASIAACVVQDEGSVLPQNDNDNLVLNLEDPVRVERVIDGDTIDVLIEGETQRVRMKGINAPELHLDTPQNDPDPYAEDARDYLLAHIGTDVEIVLDSGCDSAADCLDIYDRLLAYIKLSNGDDLGAQVLAEGLARVYVYQDEQFDRRALYEEIQADAQDAGLGIWGD